MVVTFMVNSISIMNSLFYIKIPLIIGTVKVICKNMNRASLDYIMCKTLDDYPPKQIVSMGRVLFEN